MEKLLVALREFWTKSHLAVYEILTALNVIMLSELKFL